MLKHIMMKRKNIEKLSQKNRMEYYSENIWNFLGVNYIMNITLGGIILFSLLSLYLFFLKETYISGIAILVAILLGLIGIPFLIYHVIIKYKINKKYNDILDEKRKKNK